MPSWPRSHGAQESAVSFVTAPSRLRSVQMGVTVRRRTGGGGTGSCQSEQTRDATLTSRKARWLHLWRVYLSDRVCREQAAPARVSAPHCRRRVQPRPSWSVHPLPVFAAAQPLLLPEPAAAPRTIWVRGPEPSSSLDRGLRTPAVPPNPRPRPAFQGPPGSYPPLLVPGCLPEARSVASPKCIRTSGWRDAPTACLFSSVPCTTGASPASRPS